MSVSKEKKLKSRSFKSFLFISIMAVLFSVNVLNAETIVYVEYNPIEDAYFRITEVDGVIFSIVRINEDDDE